LNQLVGQHGELRRVRFVEQVDLEFLSLVVEQHSKILLQQHEVDLADWSRQNQKLSEVFRHQSVGSSKHAVDNLSLYFFEVEDSVVFLRAVLRVLSTETTIQLLLKVVRNAPNNLRLFEGVAEWKRVLWCRLFFIKTTTCQIK